MVSADDDWSPQKMLPIFLESVHNAQQFPTGNTIPSLSTCQCSAGVTDNPEHVVLLLLKNAAERDIASVRVEDQLSSVPRCCKNRRRSETPLQLVERVLTSFSPVERRVFLS